MSVNPNVDRLSIDERLRKLESRFPGGGGGGGNFSGTLPDFDQFPDNAIKLTNEGMVLKFSDSDLGRTFGLPPVNGVSLKFCYFMPYRNGTLSYPVYACARFYYKNGISSTTAPANSNRVIPFDWSDWVNQVANANVYKGELFSARFGCGGLSSPTLSFAGVFDVQLSIAPQDYNNLNNSYTVCAITKSFSSNTRLVSGYSFASAWIFEQNSAAGFGNGGKIITSSQIFLVGGVNSGSNVSVSSLAQFPAKLNNVYPQSWLVP